MIHEVASLVKDQAQAPILPAEPPPDLRPYLKVVDVAFAIDTTASMQSTIEAARQAGERPGGGGLEAVRRRDRCGSRWSSIATPTRATGSRPGGSRSFTSPEGFLAALEPDQRGDRGGRERRRVGPRRRGPGAPARPRATRRASTSTGRPAGRGSSPPSCSSSWATPPTTPATSTGPGRWPARPGRPGITIATVAIDRPGHALARRAAAVSRPVADPGRGVVSAARQGERASPSPSRRSTASLAGGGPARRAAPGR